MRALPGLAVAAPGDPVETDAVVADLLAGGGPAYLRLGKAGERCLHPGPLRIERGESVELRPGGEVAIFSTGAILDVACAAADLLELSGVRAGVRSFPWLDPLDIWAVQHAARSHEVIVTIEEHSIVGGLGSAVAEVLAELPGAAPLVRVALPASFTSVVGDQQYLRSVYGLDPEAVSRRVLAHLEESHGLARQVR